MFGFAGALGDFDGGGADLTGTAGSVLGQFAHFVGYHGKAASGFACPCGFNRVIECQQVGLFGYSWLKLRGCCPLSCGGLLAAELGDGMRHTVKGQDFCCAA